MKPARPVSRAQSAYYNKRKSAATPAEQVGWKNEEVQQTRFDQLLRVIDLPKRFSVNDLGCGLGALALHLEHRGFADVTYHGYDVLPAMLTAARRRLPESPRRRFHHIAHASKMQRADFTLASGIFNLKGDTAEHAWLAYILETIASMVAKSRRGIAFNCLTRYSDPERMRTDLYYADPCFLFDFCKRNFSRNVALLHDYREYDFTILIRKV